jgi:hypothetical protein
MKRIWFFLFAAGLLVIGTQANSYAQQEPQWWVVREQAVRPEKVIDFVAGVSEQFAEAAKHRIPFANVDAWGSNDFHYYFAIPIGGLDAIDDLAAAWAKFRADLKLKMGDEAFARMMKKLEGTVEYDRYFVFFWRPDLSYYPATPRLKAGERLFLQWQYWYIKDDLVAEAETAAKELVKLFKDRGISELMEVSEGLLGADLPVYFAAYRGKDAADYYTHDPDRTLGNDKDYQALLARLYRATRKLERVNLDYQPALSYHPEAVK